MTDKPVSLDPFQRIIDVGWGLTVFEVDAGSAASSGYSDGAASAVSGNIYLVVKNTATPTDLMIGSGLDAGSPVFIEKSFSIPSGIEALGPPGTNDALDFIGDRIADYRLAGVDSRSASLSIEPGFGGAQASTHGFAMINLAKWEPDDPDEGWINFRCDVRAAIASPENFASTFVNMNMWNYKRVGEKDWEATKLLGHFHKDTQHGATILECRWNVKTAVFETVP